MRLILASRSPRRLDLLRGIGIEPEVLPAEIDETPLTGEAPRDLVMRLARAKGGRIVADPGRKGGTAVVLAADTAVVLDGQALGKPRDDDDARRMLGALSSREHDVLTGMYLERTDDRRSLLVVDSTRVRFRDLDSRAIAGYVSTGEPRGKAGAYAIQGLGGRLIERIQGSWSNVVGLPLELLADCFRNLEIDVDRLKRSD